MTDPGVPDGSADSVNVTVLLSRTNATVADTAASLIVNDLPGESCPAPVVDPT